MPYNISIKTKDEALSWLREIGTFTENGGLTSKASLILRKNPMVMKQFQDITRCNSEKPSELIWLLNHERTYCLVCGKPTEFIDYKMGYRKSCCQECADILTTNGGKKTKLEKHGGYSLAVKKAKETKLESVKEKQRKNKSKKYFYNDICFDSTWELAFYIKNIDEGFNVIREPKSIKYTFNGNDYSYFPDFEIDGKLYEIKGTHLIKNGIWVPNFEQVKILRSEEEKTLLYEKCKTKQQCAIDNNVKVLTYNEIKPYLQYCHDKFGTWEWANQFKKTK